MYNTLFDKSNVLLKQAPTFNNINICLKLDQDSDNLKISGADCVFWGSFPPMGIAFDKYH